ncbi:MAG: dienelactone hydrolase family protein [Vicinamibacterales bacterium]
MRVLLVAMSMLFVMSGSSRAAEIRNLSMPLPGGGELRYGLSVPDGYTPGQERPLLLALHPGGERMRYYGSAYARMVVAPAAATLGAIIVAPDCPTAAWSDVASDTAVMALVERVLGEYAVDRRRIVVVGFSMGGRGTWFMASHHRDLFTAAVPMAAAVGDEPIETLATMPTYIIHSRRDQIVPFTPAERNAQQLERLGRVVRFDALTEPTHFDMGAYVPALGRALAWVADQWSTSK